MRSRKKKIIQGLSLTKCRFMGELGFENGLEFVKRISPGSLGWKNFYLLLGDLFLVVSPNHMTTLVIN